jgi:hypothetical protein
MSDRLPRLRADGGAPATVMGTSIAAASAYVYSDGDAAHRDKIPLADGENY